MIMQRRVLKKDEAPSQGTGHINIQRSETSLIYSEIAQVSRYICFLLILQRKKLTKKYSRS